MGNPKAVFRTWASGLVAAGLLASCARSGGGGSNPAASNVNSEAQTPGPIIESFAPSSSSNAMAGERVTFLVNARDQETLAFNWSLDGSDQGIHESEMTVQTQAGDFSEHLVAVDVQNSEAETTSVLWHLQLVEQSQNQAPVVSNFIPTGDLTVTQGDDVSFSVSGSDADANDRLMYSWFVNGNTQAATGSSLLLDTASLATGTHIVEVAASDGQQHANMDSASHAWNLTVLIAQAVNAAPVIQSVAPNGAISINAGSSLNLDVSASDADGDPLTYVWWVDGVKKSATSSTYQYTPASTAVGSHAIKVKVDDRMVNSGATDPTYTWTVTVQATAPSEPIPEPDPTPTPDPNPVPSGLVALSWDAVTTDVNGAAESVSGYRVYLTQDPQSPGSPIQTVSAASVNLSGLTMGAAYSVAVSAVDSAGNESARSNWLAFVAP